MGALPSRAWGPVAAEVSVVEAGEAPFRDAGQPASESSCSCSCQVGRDGRDTSHPFGYGHVKQEVGDLEFLQGHCRGQRQMALTALLGAHHEGQSLPISTSSHPNSQRLSRPWAGWQSTMSTASTGTSWSFRNSREERPCSFARIHLLSRNLGVGGKCRSPTFQPP